MSENNITNLEDKRQQKQQEESPVPTESDIAGVVAEDLLFASEMIMDILDGGEGFVCEHTGNSLGIIPTRYHLSLMGEEGEYITMSFRMDNEDRKKIIWQFTEEIEAYAQLEDDV